MATSHRRWMGFASAAMFAVVLTWGRTDATDLTIIRDQDPALGTVPDGPPQSRFHPRLKALWLEALARPEADLKRQAAEAIAQAHGLGMTGLEDTVPRLVKELETSDSRVVRLALTRALIALNAKSAVPALMQFAQSGDADAARLVEPALMRWDYTPMRPVWQARLANSKTPREELVLAIRAAAATKLAEAAPHLRRLALNPRTAGDIRLEAARSLAVVRPTGLEADARPLAADVSPQHTLDRLLAATLLIHHRGKPTEELLLVLAGDSEPAVAAIAVGRVLELDAQLLSPRLEGLAKSPDSTLRLLAAKGLAELKTPQAVERLSPLLADPHREVRVFAKEALIRLAGTEQLRSVVQGGVEAVLSKDDARGLEQAAIVAGVIRHEPVADRLVRLLTHPAGEVRVASAWGLRRLAVPKTAAPILERVKSLTDGGSDVTTQGPVSDLEHLIEALGVLHYQPADAVLRKYIPAPPTPLPPGSPRPIWLPQLRSAAIWSLGQIHTNAAPELVTALGGLLRSQDAVDVRAAAGVALGRMKVKAELAGLRQVFAAEKEEVLVRRCAGWAVGQITGEMVILPAFPNNVRERWHTGWFLEPLEPATSNK